MSEMEPKAEDDPLPLPNHVSAALGSLFVELEATHPGITERSLARLETLQSLQMIRRLRGPAVDPTLAPILAQAVRWLGLISVMAAAELGPAEMRVKRKKLRRR